jgi:hypothetical protein
MLLDDSIEIKVSFNTNKTIKEIDNLMNLIDLSKTIDVYKDGIRHLTYSIWLEYFFSKHGK